ncbi:hypothetical protein SKAU_G00236950 [Synaphobranchus kaupii]|uniref:Reverse transcriptase domain-containing protein n=1 Tax=Synaphobranchus kaupii TaxID=118154 RepID=A0A9Q1F6T4_SYNKA|nr:hypothetical protein SKAU_G00236950 [Synaphobranchus kaupii]
MLFIDFSSAFNTIIPQQLICKLDQLGLNTSLCNWLLDFLSERPQAVRVGNNTSSSITLSTGAPQGCVLSPLLFTLLTHDCTTTYSTNHMVKFADDTTLVGLITKDDETHYKKEVDLLTTCLMTKKWPPCCCCYISFHHHKGGPKSPKISASDAVERLVVFHKSCCSLEEHLHNQQGRQPYLLAVGRQKSKIDSFYIAMDKHLIPCQANRSLGAFDELF